jgi:ABC-type multidrug transport system fused ATPase/permease subunit
MTSSTESTTEPKRHRRVDAADLAALLRRYLAPQWRRALLMAALLLGSIGLQLLVPQILRTFIDRATLLADAQGLGTLALLFLGVALLNQLLGAAATYAGADVGWRATNAVRRDLLDHCLGLDMRFHSDRTPGEMIERIDGDVTALSDFFSQFSVRVLGGFLLLVGILVLLWRESLVIGLALTLFTLLVLLVLQRTRSLGVPATEMEREANARLFGFIEERLAGIEDLRANGGGAHALHRFAGVGRHYYFRSRRAWMLQAITWLSSHALFVVGMGVTLGASIVLVRRGDITLGTGYLVFQYLLMLTTPIEQIGRQLQELQKAVASVGRVQALLAERSGLDRGGSGGLSGGPLEVALQRVSFAYRAGSPVLDEIDVRLAPGRVLGLLGRTGSGKTTLSRLLFRLHDPDAGVVRIGGTDIREVDLAELRSRVGVVTQEVQLFQASVRDNLTFFDAGVDEARLHHALDEVGLGPWLAELPEGLDTPIGSGGGNLSAGEAQLLALARVFLKDPGLVVLDEPSSRLDPATEQRLEQALDRLLQGRTAVIIAHRLETVERADDLLVLDGGRVAEHGPRIRLVADPTSHYARLLRAGRDLDADHPLEELA